MKTRASLDYETKRSYSVRIDAESNSQVEGSIDVTINITNGPDTSCPSGYLHQNNDCLLIVYGVGFGEADPLPPVTSDDAVLLASLLSMDKVIFNELLNASTDANDWVELRNITEEDIDLGGWEVSIYKSGGLAAVQLPDGTVIPAGGLFLLLNTDPNDSAMPLESSVDVGYLVDEGFVLPQGITSLDLRNLLRHQPLPPIRRGIAPSRPQPVLKVKLGRRAAIMRAWAMTATRRKPPAWARPVTCM